MCITPTCGYKIIVIKKLIRHKALSITIGALCTYIYIYMYIYTYVCMYVYRHACTYTYEYTNTHTC